MFDVVSSEIGIRLCAIPISVLTPACVLVYASSSDFINGSTFRCCDASSNCVSKNEHCFQSIIRQTSLRHYGRLFLIVGGLSS